MLEVSNTGIRKYKNRIDGSLPDLVLKGLSQIMLQENVWTGLFFLIGIFYGSVAMGLSALLATICGTITARILKFSPSERDKGLFGFSAALVGVALMLFFKPVFIVWIFVAVGAVIATVLQHFFIKRKIPVFTFPFVLVTWLFLFIVGKYFPDLRQMSEVTTTITNNYFDFSLKGYGQVIFQNNILSGVIFFIAVFICSPIAALYGLAGSVISGIISTYLFVPIADISEGLFSFNAVLCSILFSGNKIIDGLWVLISVILSLFISLFFHHFNLPQLTFPFVAASFIVVNLKQKLIFR